MRRALLMLAAAIAFIAADLVLFQHKPSDVVGPGALPTAPATASGEVARRLVHEGRLALRARQLSKARRLAELATLFDPDAAGFLREEISHAR